MMLHPNSNKPYIKLLEMSENGVKCAEIDITDMTSDQVWDAIKIQERQGRTWTYKIIKPYNWPSFEIEGEEVEDGK